jgi:outer membrane biosynthesis protein TonB
MTTARRVLTTFAPPLIYLALIYFGTRPPKAVYKYATPTVMTVTERGGPTVLHSPPVVYPPQALRACVEGTVTLQVSIAADGTVVQAVPVAGPGPLRQAAADNVRQWLFEASPRETLIDVAFSLREATRSLRLPEAVRRLTPAYRGRVRGSVRVVAMVDPHGRVEFVQPVTGPEDLVPSAVESVRRWTFRPMLRDGKPVRGTAVIDVPVGM